MKFRGSDWQSQSEMDSIRNACDVWIQHSEADFRFQLLENTICFFSFDLYFKLKRFFWYRKYEIASSSRPIFETKASTSRPKFLKPRLRLLPIVTKKKWQSLDTEESQDKSSTSENHMCSFISRKVSKLPYLLCIVSILVCIGGVNN